MKMWHFVVLIFIITQLLLPPANSLDYRVYEEGHCPEYTPQQDFDPDWFSTASLPYIGGGDKYHLYRMIFPMSNWENITTDDYFHNVCLGSFANITTGVGELSAFGKGVVARYQVTLTEQKGVIDFQPRIDTTIVSRHTATLTDGATFVFFASCWMDVNEKGFDIVSSTPSLDADTQKKIREHATSLGFDPADFIFFPDDVCDGE